MLFRAARCWTLSPNWLMMTMESRRHCPVNRLTNGLTDIHDRVREGGTMRDPRASPAVAVMLMAIAAGCGGDRANAPARARPRVVVYSSQDREFSEPVLNTFAARAGVEVLPK